MVDGTLFWVVGMEETERLRYKGREMGKGKYMARWEEGGGREGHGDNEMQSHC